jgi:hypothetical protein
MKSIPVVDEREFEARERVWMISDAASGSIYAISPVEGRLKA